MDSRDFRNRLRAGGNVLVCIGLVAYLLYELPHSGRDTPCWRMLLVYVAFITLKVMLVQAFYCRDLSKADRSNPEADRKQLNLLRREGKPFALYLRNFEIEQGWGGLAGTNTKSVETDFVAPAVAFWPVTTNILEQSIVDEISPHLPVFALVNRDDMAVGTARKIVARSERGWRAEVQELAKEAHLIAAVFKGATEGMVEELRFLQEQGLEDRLVLFVFPGGKAKLEKVVPGLLERTRWVGEIVPIQNGSDRLSSAVMPIGLKEHLRSLGSSAESVAIDEGG